MRQPNPRFPIEREDIERVIRRFYREGPGFDVIGDQIRWEMETFGDEIVDAVADFWCEVILYNNITVVPSMQMAESSRKCRIENTEIWFAALGEIMEKELTPLQAAAWGSLQQGVFTTVLSSMRPVVSAKIDYDADGARTT